MGHRLLTKPDEPGSGESRRVGNDELGSMQPLRNNPGCRLSQEEIFTPVRATPAPASQPVIQGRRFGFLQPERHQRHRVGED